MSTTSRPVTMSEFPPAGTPSYPGPLPDSTLGYQPGPPPPDPTLGFPGPPDPRLSRPVAAGPRIGDQGLRSSRTACEYSLREYVRLQRRRRPDDPVAEDRLRTQRDEVLADLRTLRRSVSALVKAGESHRWGRWVLSGLMASLIPVVRRFFRRPADDEQSSNDTEYAFRRSKSLVRRILDTVRNNSALASVTLLVLSVMYVFQAEVSLRVARTVSKRLKRLIARIETGDELIEDKDVDMFGGWRWRVLMWKS